MDGFCRGCLANFEDSTQLLHYTNKNRRQFVYSTNIEVKYNDITFQLCMECYKNMQIAAKFKKKCKTTDKILKKFMSWKDSGNDMDFCTFLRVHQDYETRSTQASGPGNSVHQKNKGNEFNDNESVSTSIMNFMSDILEESDIEETQEKIIKELVEEEIDIQDDTLDSQWLRDDISIDLDFQLDFGCFASPKVQNVQQNNNVQKEMAAKCTRNLNKCSIVANIEKALHRNKQKCLLDDLLLTSPGSSTPLYNSDIGKRMFDGTLVNQKITNDTINMVPNKHFELLTQNQTNLSINKESSITTCEADIQIGNIQKNINNNETVNKSIEEVRNEGSSLPIHHDNSYAKIEKHIVKLQRKDKVPYKNLQLLKIHQEEIDSVDDIECDKDTESPEEDNTELSKEINTESPKDSSISIHNDNMDGEIRKHKVKFKTRNNIPYKNLGLLLKHQEKPDSVDKNITTSVISCESNDNKELTQKVYTEMPIEDNASSKGKNTELLKENVDKNKQNFSKKKSISEGSSPIHHDMYETIKKHKIININTSKHKSIQSVTKYQEIVSNDKDATSIICESVNETDTSKENNSELPKDENTESLKQKSIQSSEGKKKGDRNAKNSSNKRSHNKDLKSVVSDNGNREVYLYTVTDIIKCRICHEVFKSTKHLVKHYKLCHNIQLTVKRRNRPNGGTCDICKKHFSQLSNLKVHLKTHEKKHVDAINKCDICGMSFDRKWTLKLHMSTHQEKICNLKEVKNPKIYKYLCVKCSYRSNSLSNLNIHMKRHNKAFSVFCETCNKGFYRKCDLTRHIMEHTGEKPYKCLQCSSKFRRSDYLVQHMRIHTGERPFVCDVCDATYRQVSELKYHKRRACLGARHD